MELWSDFSALVSALASRDSWTIRQALAPNSVYVFGAVFLVLAGLALSWVYHHVPIIERYFERTVMIVCYLGTAGIIFWGVIDRFVFSNQQPWSTTIPPFLFMVMAWFGAAYNIRVRTHLSFSEFRSRMSRGGQIVCLWLDFVLWFGFALIFLVTTMRVVALSASNFQIVLGTDNTMQWWFLLSAPVAGTLMAARAVENIQDDMKNYRTGQPLILQSVIGGDT
ncbi:MULTISPECIES: TRAP transporter small permease [Marivita]|uniref:TRAP transporter small permease protein n=1 Tax=Marivita cryptomonadis TaxID=505252 RepID=A0A9Q2NWT4_9RHOB|nr:MULTISPECIES: TRAP transporter small permease subunit [Marivita]MCR9166736.1 TRAP transporter small permease subunit [Paracoccaceae bacterium]MBM2321221.1 TRAP transporter small permease subunit [Marivita cryptomonadis]MBM2330802.1 TRAP transporter small permease subunit [Marivita cryptomonadis]MBM2340388.1 TRAP transporter small permease subunit [Marivita cryptomonadis]MBM2345050.1 TRAP transporter small permease subunit [Marivita cryptomonadis]